MLDDQPAPAPDPAPAPETGPPSWDDAFKGEDPVKVRKALDHAREWEKRAKENATAATELAKIQDAQKTEAERAADRIAKAEAEAATVPEKVAAALRAHLVTLHQIPADRAELYLTATDPDLLLRQVTGLVADQPRKGNQVRREGVTPPPPLEDDVRAFARDLFAQKE